jgi:glycosyltransferase involved in cell wall biosynthesis
MSKKISIVVVTLNIDILRIFLESVKDINSKEVEMIIINQTQTCVENFVSKHVSIDYKIINIQDILSASFARNLGEESCTGEYVYFADDDCSFFNITNKDIGHFVDFINSHEYDVYVFPRGEIIDANFIIKNKIFPVFINCYNFPIYTIEWNVVIKRSLFRQFNGFKDIGTGSNHAAQSGEMFELFSNFFDKKIHLYKDIKVGHPSLIISNRVKFLRYEYGASYAAGISIKNFSKNICKLYWLARGFFACFKYSFSIKNYNVSLIKFRAFFRGVSGIKPHSKSKIIE